MLTFLLYLLALIGALLAPPTMTTMADATGGDDWRPVRPGDVLRAV